jgi:hypothetical protein
MPRLLLTHLATMAESIRRAQTLDDKYGFRQSLREKTVEELVAAFNREVGIRAWVSARAVYLMALRDALLATGLDCSSFISDDGMEMDQVVTRKGDAIVPVTEGAGAQRP